ncbi:hypothetical protein [Methanorbis furvi]
MGLLTADEFLPGFHMTGVFGAVCAIAVVIFSVVVKDKIVGKE